MISYHGRRFRPVQNSPEGQVSGGTLFEYTQQDDILTATYSGGGILRGHMLGHVGAQGELRFSYHHISTAGELRAGFCHSTPEILPDGRIRLRERWQWTLGAESSGESVVEEVFD